MMHDRASLKSGPMPDLAPEIYRQRLVVEGTPLRPIEEAAVSQYLRELSTVTGMKRLIEPVTHRSELYGWAGWVHWENSGAHIYTWTTPQLFFSVDIYTCAEFKVGDVLDFTAAYFDAEELAAREF
jgi:S-adenosylmethionine decarboxylase